MGLTHENIQKFKKFYAEQKEKQGCNYEFVLFSRFLGYTPSGDPRYEIFGYESNLATDFKVVKNYPILDCFGLKYNKKDQIIVYGSFIDYLKYYAPEIKVIRF